MNYMVRLVDLRGIEPQDERVSFAHSKKAFAYPHAERSGVIINIIRLPSLLHIIKELFKSWWT